ncbi:MAG: hypothetical protein K0S11_1058 [Gammaproteobacteria bacterium]|jgi:hypothetical protein|nr:hypothetical protein [Gammaproteobacteria bacterium]
MFGAVKYLVIILFLIYVFNTFLEQYRKTELDGNWHNEKPNAVIESMKINVTGSSYLILNQEFAKQEKLPRYYTLSFIRSSPGGFLSSLAYYDEDKLKSDIFLSIVPLSKREIIITDINTFKICNPQKCLTIDDIKENKFVNTSTLFTRIADFFV